MQDSAARDKVKRTGSVVEINDTGETKAGRLVEAGHPGGRSRRGRPGPKQTSANSLR